jgi:hypothetical protein
MFTELLTQEVEVMQKVRVVERGRKMKVRERRSLIREKKPRRR